MDPLSSNMSHENLIRPSLWLSSFAEHLQFKYEIEGPFRGRIDSAFLDEVTPRPEIFLRNAHTNDGVGLRQLKDFLVHLCQLKSASGSTLFTLDGAAYLTDALMRVRVHCYLVRSQSFQFILTSYDIYSVVVYGSASSCIAAAQSVSVPVGH